MPELTLYCFAHAGGSPLAYARWTKFLPEEVRIRPLELPGHGSRLREPVLSRLDAVLAEVLPQIPGTPGERFALFGHSFGALVAYELARLLQQRGTPPAALIAAGRNTPATPPTSDPIHRLPEEEFVGALGRYGGLPPELLDQRELLRMYLPALRADMQMTETYAHRPGVPLTMPVATIAGRRDHLTDPRGVLAWERETTAAFDLTFVPAGHFFLTAQEFRSALASRLTRLVPHLDPAARAIARSRAAGARVPAAASTRS
jgi:medium-chain acyl-[acyl-carrier-protein] hydrolase